MKKSHILYCLAAFSALVAVAVSADTYTGKPDPYNKTVTITIPTGTYAAKATPTLNGNTFVDGGITARSATISGAATITGATSLGAIPQDAGVVTAIKGVFSVDVQKNIGSIASKGTSTETFTIAGVASGDMPFLTKASGTMPAGVVYRCFVSTTDTVSCEFSNNTASPVDPNDQTYTFIVFDMT